MKNQRRSALELLILERLNYEIERIRNIPPINDRASAGHAAALDKLEFAKNVVSMAFLEAR